MIESAILRSRSRTITITNRSSFKLRVFSIIDFFTVRNYINEIDLQFCLYDFPSRGLNPLKSVCKFNGVRILSNGCNGVPVIVFAIVFAVAKDLGSNRILPNAFKANASRPDKVRQANQKMRAGEFHCGDRRTYYVLKANNRTTLRFTEPAVLLDN